MTDQGIDPKAEQRGKGAPAVKDLFDRYMADHVKRLPKDSTAREYDGVFKKHLSAPLAGSRECAATSLPTRSFGAASPPLMPSEAKPIAPPPNSRKPGG